MSNYTEIVDIPSLQRNVSNLAREINTWLNTSGTDWNGCESALSAAGTAYFPFIEYGWEDVEKFYDKDLNLLWTGVLAQLKNDDWLDKSDYFGASSFADESGVFYSDEWGEREVEYYMEEDGLSKESANDLVMNNFREIAFLAHEYALKMLEKLRKIEDYLVAHPVKSDLAIYYRIPKK